MEKITAKIRTNLQKIQSKTQNIVTELRAKRLSTLKDELRDPKETAIYKTALAAMNQYIQSFFYCLKCAQELRTDSIYQAVNNIYSTERTLIKEKRSKITKISMDGLATMFDKLVHVCDKFVLAYHTVKDVTRVFKHELREGKLWF